MPKLDPMLAQHTGQTYDHLPPTYILNPHYCFIDWNSTFDEIVALPLGLEKGQHVSEFVKQLEDKEKILERATRIFGIVGNIPFVDQEVLVWKSKQYGKITFRKIASQIISPQGEQLGWVVHLGIESATKLNELWESISSKLEQRYK